MKLIAVLSVLALSVLASASLATASPGTTYTCTKTNEHNGNVTTVTVPEQAVSGLENAGFTCVQDTTDPGDGGGGGNGDDDPPVVPQPAVLVTPTICSDGLPPDAGKDGWVSALGNTNDDCDHSGDPRLNNGVDTRTRW